MKVIIINGSKNKNRRTVLDRRAVGLTDEDSESEVIYIVSPLVAPQPDHRRCMLTRACRKAFGGVSELLGLKIGSVAVCSVIA